MSGSPFGTPSKYSSGATAPPAASGEFGSSRLVPYGIVSNVVRSVVSSLNADSSEYQQILCNEEFIKSLQESTTKFIVEVTRQCFEAKSLLAGVERERDKDRDREDSPPVLLFLDHDDIPEALKQINFNNLQPTLPLSPAERALRGTSEVFSPMKGGPVGNGYTGNDEEIFKSKAPNSLYKINQGPSKNVQNWIQNNPNVDLNVCLGNALVLKRLVTCIKESGTQTEVNFEFCPSSNSATDSSDGDQSNQHITIQSLGPQNISLLSVHLRPSAFEYYECAPTGVTLGLNLTALEQFLKGATKTDQLTILHTTNSKQCTFFLEDPLYRYQLFNLRLKTFESPFFLPDTPHTKYHIDLLIPSPVLQRLFRDLKANIKGDDVFLKASKAPTGRVRFTAEGAFGDIESSLEEPLITVQLNNAEKTGVSVKFSLGYLSRFLRAPMAEMVKVRIGEGVALLCSYDMEELGDVQFYLAPKI